MPRMPCRFLPLGLETRLPGRRSASVGPNSDVAHLPVDGARLHGALHPGQARSGGRRGLRGPNGTGRMANRWMHYLLISVEPVV